MPHACGFLALNVSAATALTPAFAHLLDQLPPRRNVLEITEHEAIDDCDSLNAALKPLPDQGLRIVVDDTGAGFASMHHVLALLPGFIKLDISLVRGIDRDPARQALAAALAAFASQTDAALIAEGIETPPNTRAYANSTSTTGRATTSAVPTPNPGQRQPHPTPKVPNARCC